MAPAGSERAELERKRLGLDHAAAGALLVGLSEPADDVTRAIAYHHGGPTGLACPSNETACVIVADSVAHLLTGGEADKTLLGIALERLDAGHRAARRGRRARGRRADRRLGRPRRGRRPPGGRRPHRRPDRPAQPPQLDRDRPARARGRHRGRAADLRHRRLQVGQRPPRPSRRRPRADRGRARARAPRRRRAARRRRVRRLGARGRGGGPARGGGDRRGRRQLAPGRARDRRGAARHHRRGGASRRRAAPR